MKKLTFKQLKVGEIYIIADKKSKYGTGEEGMPVKRIYTSDDLPLDKQTTLISLQGNGTWMGKVGFKFYPVTIAYLSIKYGVKQEKAFML